MPFEEGVQVFLSHVWSNTWKSDRGSGWLSLLWAGWALTWQSVNFYCDVTGKKTPWLLCGTIKELVTCLEGYSKLCMGEHKKIIPKLQNLSVQYSLFCFSCLVFKRAGACSHSFSRNLFQENFCTASPPWQTCWNSGCMFYESSDKSLLATAMLLDNFTLICAECILCFLLFLSKKCNPVCSW